ncbi:MAG: hypothetical protein ABI321_22290 [Polyangia bacterium]
MKACLVALALCCSVAAHAETPQSPYRIYWALPDNDLSGIDVDRGDLSVSRFESNFDLVRWLAAQPKPRKPARAKPGEASIPDRELKIQQLDGAGGVRTTVTYTMPIAAWRRLIGERMVERLEDEFDAHLRMLFPRRAVPTQHSEPTK